jgi:SAM-dependent methyltransferase
MLLLNCTETPAIDMGSGIADAEAVLGARFEPKMETSEPGVTGLAKLAPLTTGFVPSTGWQNAVAAVARNRMETCAAFISAVRRLAGCVDYVECCKYCNDAHMDSAHQERILDQFTRQASPFANAPAIRNQEALNRIVAMSEAGPDDNVLDVACGPGLLACAFAKVVRHATGIDVTPAMLEQARMEQRRNGLENVTWRLGNVPPLPFADEDFSIVTARFALHHFQDPLMVLKEMRRVCKVGGRVAIADSAPAAAKADAFNAMERLRDPSHARAMPVEELRGLFLAAGLPEPREDFYRLEAELDGLLERSFPNPGDQDRIRKIFEDSLSDDALDMATHRRDEQIRLSFPVAILVAQNVAQNPRRSDRI